MFTITHYDNKYFAKPTNEYLNLYPNILDVIYPKYSYGAKDVLAICELHYDNENKICLHRFDNYYLRYAFANNKEYNGIHKGLGLRLLKSVIIKLLNDQKIDNNYNFSVWISDNENKKLINYYNSMSFEFTDKDKIMETTIDKFLDNTKDIIIFS